MTYTKQTWAVGQAGGSPLSAARFNHMEDGIEAIHLDSESDYLAVGEATIPRRAVISTAVAIGTGSLRLTYFTARVTEVVTQVRTLSGSTAAVGSTLCRIGVYSADAGTGNLTLVASTASDTALWSATNTAYTKTLSASFTKQRGTRYAVGVLCVGASTPPTLAGQASLAAAEAAVAPRLCGFLSSQTDLPSTATEVSLVATAIQTYSVLLP